MNQFLDELELVVQENPAVVFIIIIVIGLLADNF